MRKYINYWKKLGLHSRVNFAILSLCFGVILEELIRSMSFTDLGVFQSVVIIILGTVTQLNFMGLMLKTKCQ